MLTAKELVRAVKEVKDEVVNNEGDKNRAKVVDSKGNKSESEVRERVNAMIYPLTQPRVGIKSSLSEGAWCPDTSRVIITRNTGKQELGPLCPEEALHLLESNSLYLTRSGVPLSIQAAYTLLLSPLTGVTTTEYMVYSKLARAGYKVIRHQGKMDYLVMKENVGESVDKDVDKSLLTPLYGMSLVVQPGEDPPPWLQDIRDAMVPHSTTPPPWSQYGLNCWLKDMVEDLLEEALEHSEEKKRKRRSSIVISEKPSKLRRIDDGGLSPKYEPCEPDDEDSLSVLCARCVRRHAGGQEECLAREKCCEVCNKEGHIKNVHRVEDEILRKRIALVLGLSEWDLWGRFAPEIVTIEEESEEELLHVDDDDDDATNSDNQGNIEFVENTSEVNQLFINPFHEEELSEEEETTANSSEGIEMEPPIADSGLDKDIAEVNKLSQKRLDSLNSFNSLVGDIVNSHAAEAREEIVKSANKTPVPVSALFSCSLCGISCSSKVHLQSHYQGKAHMKKLKLKTGGSELLCTVCGVKASSPATLLSHYQGKKHLRAVASKTRSSLSGDKSTPGSAGSCSPTDDVMIVEDEVPPAPFKENEVERIEVVASDAVENEKKTLKEIHNEIPNCDGKSLLILNRPARSLVPNNTWHYAKHSSFLELDKLMNIEVEKQESDQRMFEDPDFSEDNIQGTGSTNEGKKLWCPVCEFGLETDSEFRCHVESELHRGNQSRRERSTQEDREIQMVETVEIDLTEGIDEGTDTNEIIVLEEDVPALRRPLTTPLTRPFRGFWPSSQVSRPLASVRGTFVTIINFGFHSKPGSAGVSGARRDRGRTERGGVGGKIKDNVARGRTRHHPDRYRGMSDGRGGGGRGLTKEKVEISRMVRQGWSKGDLRHWVKDTESCSGSDQAQSIAEDIMGIGMDEENSEVDNIEDIVRRSKIWMKSKNGESNNCSGDVHEVREEDQEPATDVVDLSSSDEDVAVDERRNDADIGFNITNVRSLTPDSTLPHNLAKLDTASLTTNSDSLTSSSTEHSSDLDDVSAHSELRYFKTGPLASIWCYEGQVGPLISPEMGGSLREVYSRLTMDPPVTTKFKGSGNKLVVTYDLYLAENYKKSQRPAPDYRIIIQTMSSPLPSMRSLEMLSMQYKDNTPFLFAVVSGGTVTFFSLDNIELPRYFRDI